MNNWRKILMWQEYNETSDDLEEIFDLVNTPTKGNAFENESLLNKLTDLITSNLSMELKIIVLQKIYDVLGMKTPVNEDEVYSYLEYLEGNMQ
jgi:hypothetical protein